MIQYSNSIRIMGRTNEEVHRLSAEFAPRNVAAWCDLFHPVRSRYIDPVFGEYNGREAIRNWLVEVMGRAGEWRSRGAGTRFFDGSVAAGEAELTIDLGGSRFVLPFAWIQKYDDGWIVYRRDYYDTYELRQRVDEEALRKPRRAAGDP